MLKSKRGQWERVAHMVAHTSLGCDVQVDTIWPVRQLGVFVCIFEVVRFFFPFFFLHFGGLKWLLEKQKKSTSTQDLQLFFPRLF